MFCEVNMDLEGSGEKEVEGVVKDKGWDWPGQGQGGACANGTS